MANGIIIRNKKGTIIFDGTSRLPKVKGTFEAALTGSQKIELSSPQAKLWIHTFSTKGQDSGYRANPPKVWVDGDTIRWITSGTYPISITVTWGEY